MIGLLERLLKIYEGWKDVYHQFVDSGKVSAAVFTKFRTEDPSDTKKYLQWMCKQYISNPGRQTHIVDVVKMFDQQVQRNLIKGDESDINKYDLEGADKVAKKQSQEKTHGEVKREQKSESIIVDETDDYLIVVPESHSASCFYGANTKWCTSGKTAEHWDSYWKENIKIYIIIDKKKNKKYAIAVGPNGAMEAFDEKDRKISLPSIEKQMGLKLPDIFKPLTKQATTGRKQKQIEEILFKSTKNPDGTYSTDGDVNFSSMGLKKLPVKFKYVGGDFDCYDNELTSLNGAPSKVGGNFYCNHNQLTSLNGAPSEVGGDFDCEYNQLASLEGAPSGVDGNFYCYNNRLASLEGAPSEVGGSFKCNDNQLTSLNGAPSEVGGNFDCYDNELTSLNGAPSEVGGDFDCEYNQLPRDELMKTVDRSYLK